MSNGSPGTDPDKVISGLRLELKRVSQHRDELERDVENLCMQNDSSGIFSSSLIVSERIYSTEKELSKTKSQLEAVLGERDSLRDDLRHHKESKRLVDKSWRDQTGKTEVLQRDLNFYQSQGARAVADRDKAFAEAEELREQVRDLEARLQDETARAESSSAEQVETEHQLSGARSQVVRLEERVRECEVIPGLRRDLKQARTQVDQLRGKCKALRDELTGAKEELEQSQQQCAASKEEVQALEARVKTDSDAASTAQAELQQQKSALEEEVGRLKEARQEATAAAERMAAELETAKDEVRRLRGQSQDLERTSSQQLQSQKLDMESLHATEITCLQDTVKDLSQRCKELKDRLDQASQQKVDALIRLSNAEHVASNHSNQTQQLQEQIKDLQSRLTQATQEKLAALMQLAGGNDTKNGNKDLKSPERPRKTVS
ncbi:hypothetical protein WJX74_005694 [Apatococcus lobatus]|uniref:Uncharacterized protein n=1 Tax=Apatococcus lobatus TaxID=904363 RepID=A0AAW1R3Z5_9CHLO